MNVYYVRIDNLDWRNEVMKKEIVVKCASRRHARKLMNEFIDLAIILAEYEGSIPLRTTVYVDGYKIRFVNVSRRNWNEYVMDKNKKNCSCTIVRGIPFMRSFNRFINNGHYRYSFLQHFREEQVVNHPII